MEESEFSRRLETFGVKPAEIQKILKNKKLKERLRLAIAATGCPEALAGSDIQLWQARGPLILKICQKENAHLELLARYIGEGKIVSMEQTDAAIDFTTSKRFVPEKLDEEAGVGIVVSDEDILRAVENCIKENTEEISHKGVKAGLGIVVNGLKKVPEMKFANRQKIVETVKKCLDSFTPVDSVETKPVKQPKPAKSAKPAVEAPVEEVSPDIDFQGIVAAFPTPADNAMENSPEIQAEHMKIIDGKFRTRFPPEPNGWIHIGHAKAMFLDFGLAEQKGGYCYMRFDDTNPAKEKDEFIEGIKKDVQWMGFQWWKITHTSDYFDQLYAFAIQLIKDGLAYVCHQTKDEIRDGRQKHEPSPWRDRPVAESLREFELMRCGYYAQGEATLRLKMDYTSPNPNMYDLIAYRVVHKPLPRTGDRWCIYPTYDFSHCVVDSIEHITHSLCTLEFENRRQSYYWLLDALKIYKPFVWEFSRLNLTYTIMSKRALQTLVHDGLVNGWDDPRMPTLAGFRRKGYTPSAIREFVKSVGYTRNVKSTVPYEKLEFIQRQELDETAPRAFCVLDPLKVTIVNLEQELEVEAPKFPPAHSAKNPNAGVRTMKAGKVVYIDRSDFMEDPPAKFARLSPKSTVGLKYANLVLKLIKIVKDGDKVTELICENVAEKASKYIQWCSTDALKCELRLYNNLFKSEEPMAQKSWKDDINPESLVVVKDALVEPSVAVCKEGDHFQFERVGFFVVDQDSTPENLVFNRTVGLKSSY